MIMKRWGQHNLILIVFVPCSSFFSLSLLFRFAFFIRLLMQLNVLLSSFFTIRIIISHICTSIDICTIRINALTCFLLYTIIYYCLFVYRIFFYVVSLFARQCHSDTEFIRPFTHTHTHSNKKSFPHRCHAFKFVRSREMEARHTRRLYTWHRFQTE